MTDQAPQPEDETIAGLYRRAFAEFGPRALWSSKAAPEPTAADAMAIARALRTHGGMNGRRLAERIEKLCAGAHN